MKKRIILLIMILLLTTGCTSEYNLTIDNNVYQEKVNINGITSDELSNLNRDWQIPIDKDEYNNISGDPSSEIKITGDTYSYNVSGNNLTFNYDFTRSTLNNSTAISICYDKATITNYEDSIVISTSSKVTCFNKYPYLTSIKVNITTDKSVTSHNADSVNGNTYIWNINKGNSTNKSINMIINNQEDDSQSQTTPGNNTNIESENKSKDYTLYIFCVILLIVLLLGYFIFKKIINKNNDEMDD